MYHIVRPGESLHSIAVQYNTTVRHLMDLNPQIPNPHRIHVGERIKVSSYDHRRWSHEYQRGIEEHRRGVQEYHRGIEEYHKGHAQRHRNW